MINQRTKQLFETWVSLRYQRSLLLKDWSLDHFQKIKGHLLVPTIFSFEIKLDLNIHSQWGFYCRRCLMYFCHIGSECLVYRNIVMCFLLKYRKEVLVLKWDFFGKIFIFLKIYLCICKDLLHFTEDLMDLEETHTLKLLGQRFQSNFRHISS